VHRPLISEELARGLEGLSSSGQQTTRAASTVFDFARVEIARPRVGLTFSVLFRDSVPLLYATHKLILFTGQELPIAVREWIDPPLTPDGPPFTERESARCRFRLAEGIEEGYAAVYRESESKRLVVVYGLRFASPEDAARLWSTARVSRNPRTVGAAIGSSSRMCVRSVCSCPAVRWSANYAESRLGAFELWRVVNSTTFTETGMRIERTTSVDRSGSPRSCLPRGLFYSGRWFEKHAVARHRSVGALTAIEAAGRPLS
jgi:hypothetical protein